MDMFKMIKEAAAMKSKLSEMEKKLKDKTVEVENNGVKVKSNAKLEIVEIKLSQELLNNTPEKAEKAVLLCIQSAQKKAHELMMEEAKSITGGMKIPGLF